MKKSFHVVSAAILAMGLHNAWAADPSAADKPGMGDMNQGGMQQGGMKNGEMKGMDKEHMKQMHEHMDEMHKSMGKSDAMKGDGKCEMKSDGKCDAKDMKSMNSHAADKANVPAKNVPTKADEHSEHHQ